VANNPTTLVIRILADAKQAQQTFSKAGGKASKFASGMGKAALPAAALLAGLGAMGKAAADDAQGQAVLANQLRKSAGASDKQIANTEDWISTATLATGVADDQLRPALASLARATGDVGTAQGDMTTVLDVAAATGKDVTTDADALAKGYAGNTGAIGRLVPGLDAATVKSGDMAAIMDELGKKTGGTAKVAANTAAGKWKRMQTALSETKEGIGAGLLPVLDTLGGWLARFGGWAANNAGAVKIFAIAFGVLATAILLANAAISIHTTVTTISTIATKAFAKESKLAAAATKVWAAVQWAMNAAMAANPIVLIIIVILLLVAAVVIAYKKSETFRKIVQAAWNGIKNAAIAVWNFLKRYVFTPLIAYYKALWEAAKIAVDKVIKIWDGLKAAFKAVWDWLKSNVFDPIIAIFDKIVDAIKTVIDWIKKIKIPKAVQWLIDKGKAVFGQAAPPQPPPAPAPRGRGAPPPAPAAGARRSPSGSQPLVVNVILDGKRVGGYVDRIVTNRLDAEGFALAAGAWGT
jgi:hypothetical protein